MPSADTITMPVGATRSILWTYKDSTGVAIDITGAALTFSVKRSVLDSVFLFQKKNLAGGGSTDNDFLITSGPGGAATINVAAADTSGFAAGAYVYDVKVVIGGTVTDFPSIGVFTLTDHAAR